MVRLFFAEPRRSLFLLSKSLKLDGSHLKDVFHCRQGDLRCPVDLSQM